MQRKGDFPLFRTIVDVPSPLRQIGVEERHVFLGSCFAEHIGGRFAENHLRTLVNPTGVLYNPESIAMLLRGEEGDVVFHQGMWHSWLGDSSLSRRTEEDCRSAVSEAQGILCKALAEADNLFLTLGTSHCYVHKPSGRVVANCHRVPSGEFDEVELTEDDIVTGLNEALISLHEQNPRLQVVFTVSPYRYAKYGFHESQLSKARLLLAVERLRLYHPDWVSYFPAYEIVMDELRDYRFYASDMLHPSQQAVDYIWERLVETFFSSATQDYLHEWQPVKQALSHRPFNPDSAEHQAFIQQTQMRIDALRQRYSNLSLDYYL